jgi:hypothetical protein
MRGRNDINNKKRGLINQAPYSFTGFPPEFIPHLMRGGNDKYSLHSVHIDNFLLGFVQDAVFLTNLCESVQRFFKVMHFMGG